MFPSLFSLNLKKLSFISAFFFLLTLFVAKPEMPKRTDYLPPPVAIKNMTVGFSVALADSFWLRSVQDFDYCENKIKDNECQGKSWLFQTLNLTTELDPRIAASQYQVAGLALTVIISDYAGASVIFDKGVMQHPESWQLTYAAAYHALFEEKDKLKASRLYKLAGEHGAPSWVMATAGRLAAEGGSVVDAERILRGLIESNSDPKVIRQLTEKLSKYQTDRLSQ